jgi:hypothetical protein
MPQLSTQQYDALERAIVDQRRIAVTRSGNREVVIVPRALRLIGGRERIDATHPTTGDRLTIYLDEIVRFEVVP